MSHKNKRRPDYAEKYPDTNISDEVLQYLKKADRKMEYLEHDIKRDRYARGKDGKLIRDENGQPVKLPEREISLDKLISEDWEFSSGQPSPEDEVIAGLEIAKLYHCLDLLSENERALIQALFFDDLKEREYSLESGIAQKTINDRKHRILGKLKKFLQK